MTAHDARDEEENRRDKGRNRRDGGRNRRDKGRNRRDGTVNNGHETIRMQCNVTVGPRAPHAERDGYYVPRAESDRGATRLAAPTRARRRACSTPTSSRSHTSRRAPRPPATIALPVAPGSAVGAPDRRRRTPADPEDSVPHSGQRPAPVDS